MRSTKDSLRHSRLTDGRVQVAARAPKEDRPKKKTVAMIDDKTRRMVANLG